MRALPEFYSLERLEAAFPPVGPQRPANGSGPRVDDFFREGVSVDELIAAAQTPGTRHTSKLRLAAHWVMRGYSDAEISLMGEGLGHDSEQTRRKFAEMISDARVKWNTPNPVHAVGPETAEPPAPFEPAFIADLDIVALPRRRWLLGNSILRGKVTAQIAPPGAGKSTLGLEQGVAVVTGRPITQQEVHEQAKVWVYNAEDDGDELKRRLAGILQHWDIPLAEIKGRLALNSGADRSLLVASTDRFGNVVRMPDVDSCIQHIEAQGIGLFVVDPFVEVHEVEENNNAQVKRAAGMFREIARSADCAIVLAHHTRKPAQGAADGYAGNADAGRGATSLIGVVRIVQTLFAMSAKDADNCGIPADDRHLYVRLDDAKANFSLISSDARWFKRVGVTIANGDEVGVLEPVDLSAAEAEARDAKAGRDKILMRALLAQVPEAEISLNTAAKRLAWSSHTDFERYRQTDAKGAKRASQSLRDAIRQVCAACVTVRIGDKSAGFTIDTTRTPVVLKRFASTETTPDEPCF